VPGDAFDRKRFDHVSRDDQCQDKERSCNSFASHIELHGLIAALDLKTAAIGPFPKAFESFQCRIVKNVVSTEDTALAW
jgi:hypothetical protein